MHVKKVFRKNPNWVDTLNRFMKTKKLTSKNKWNESFPCKDFNKRYSFKSLLVKHKVTVHEGYESHHFRYCNASFTSKLLQNKHNKALPLVTFRYLTYVRKILVVLINFSPFAGKSGIAIKNIPQIMLVIKSEENCEQIGFRHKRWNIEDKKGKPFQLVDART